MTQLTDIVQKAAETINQNEKFMVPVLAARATKAAQANPQDAPLITASNVLNKMASDNITFITRADLNKLYDHLESPYSKLAEVFEKELDRKPIGGPKIMARSEHEEQPLEHDYGAVTDPLLSNALMAAFDGGEDKVYSSKLGEKAEKSCLAALRGAGVTPKKVDVFAGRDDVIICQATYETPKGYSHALVPVETKDDKALLPTMFLSRAGFVDIEKDNIEDHVVQTAGKHFKVDGQKLLDIICTAKNGVDESVSDVEIAAMKLKAEKETPGIHAPNGITYMEVDAADTIVEDPQYEQSPEHESFAKRLASPIGIARHVHGDNITDGALNYIKRQLNDFGFKDVQVSVADVDDNSISIAAAVDHKSGVKVPMKLSDGKLVPPSVAIASGNVDSFSAEGISRLIGNSTDTRMLAVASPLYGTKPSELMQQVHDGIAEGNLVKVEDAIDVLGEVDPHAQQRALGMLVDSFNTERVEKFASEHDKCSMVIKNSTSNQPICGHLNMPLHKVYQDRHGQCQPLYRKGMEETSEGGIFMNHKVFF